MISQLSQLVKKGPKSSLEAAIGPITTILLNLALQSEALLHTAVQKLAIIRLLTEALDVIEANKTSFLLDLLHLIKLALTRLVADPDFNLDDAHFLLKLISEEFDF